MNGPPIEPLFVEPPDEPPDKGLDKPSGTILIFNFDTNPDADFCR